MSTLYLKQHVASLVDSKGNKYDLLPEEVVPHMIDVKGEFVVAKPEPQPTVEIEIQVDVQAYRQFGLTCKLGKQFNTQ